MMLILLAGLQSRPLDVVEAARIDGASTWQIFTHMTLPHLRQYIELSGLLGAIYVVANFDYVFTITSGGLGTANLPYYIYQTFYTAQDYGRASAAGVVDRRWHHHHRHRGAADRVQPLQGGVTMSTATRHPHAPPVQPELAPARRSPFASHRAAARCSACWPG